ncbi:radical SAM protein [Streptomyces sp. NPDC001177]
MHRLIASPFLGQHLLLQPGHKDGLLLPEANYEALRTHDPAQPAPVWLADTVMDRWGTDVAGPPTGDFLLVRQPSFWGYGKASWEVNLGCNYRCKHCYLGLKVNSGMPWEDKRHCLDMMAEAGVLWLQITGGEPTIEKDFIRSYRHAYELGMMLTVSTNGSLLWRERPRPP